MAFDPTPEIKDLTWPEWMAWAMTVWGGGARVAGRGKAHVEAFDYDSWPTRIHAMWLCTMGLSNDPKVSRVNTQGKFYARAKTSMGRIYAGLQLGDSFTAFCAAAAIPRVVENYAIARKDARGFQYDSFDGARVEAAIASWPDIRDRHPPEPRDFAPATTQGGAETTTTATHASQPVVLVGSRRLVPVVRNRLQWTEAKTAGAGTLVASDASLIAAREDDRLRIARLNRVTGESAEWERALDLSRLGAGAVLAVGGAGRADVAFVWASPKGTFLYVARHAESSLEVVDTLASRQAEGAVMSGSRVLLHGATRDGSGECPAFPDLKVSSLVAAAAGGAVVVLAHGLDANDGWSAWVERDGRLRYQVDSGATLRLDLPGGGPPHVVDSRDRVVPLSPQPMRSRPFEHWTSPLLGMERHLRR
ncbi:hypothetical protein ASD62_03410 [Phycicoccus sp. Root563]|uniref:hypothetical protein n=1 Tax=Phycicoccus sp. Root563 TaxID=1736562 RepID=UPI0007036A24|nr:hypothetical protein [Phycicoccus sp. Root563]KQZ88506.1 hypothetical protein ASD62_03410 [Phycicoccus sp. Root563]